MSCPQLPIPYPSPPPGHALIWPRLRSLNFTRVNFGDPNLGHEDQLSSLLISFTRVRELMIFALAVCGCSEDNKSRMAARSVGSWKDGDERKSLQTQAGWRTSAVQFRWTTFLDFLSLQRPWRSLTWDSGSKVVSVVECKVWNLHS